MLPIPGSSLQGRERRPVRQRHSSQEIRYIVASHDRDWLRITNPLRGHRAADLLGLQITGERQKENRDERAKSHLLILLRRARKYSPMPTSNVAKPAKACAGR